MAILKQQKKTRNGSRANLISGLPEAQNPSVQLDHQLNVSIKGRGSVHAFQSSHLSNDGGLITGKLSGARFQDWVAGYFPQAPVANALVHPRASTAALLAATNPSRPDIQLPVFWLELKDLPDMLRQIGRFCKRIYFSKRDPRELIRPGHFIEDIAAMNLAIQFGWRPFVSDLWKIATLQDSVEKRRKELQRLYASDGLKRRVNFGVVTGPVIRGTSSANSDLGAFISTPYLRVDTIESWGTIRWKPTSGMPEWRPTDGQLRRQLTGLSADAILLNIWEALPWSWLVDWFIPIGNTIAGGNRTIATPGSDCIMRRRVTITRWASVRLVQDPRDPLILTSGVSKSWIHERAVGGALSGSSSFPTLGANQLSILGSLSVLKAR